MENFGAGGQTDRSLLYCKLACLLDDHAQPGKPAGGGFARADTVVPPKSGHPPYSTPGNYIKALARLGGWLAERPPGNMVIWRGWRRLEDILLGLEIAKTYG
ncbi:MAG: hypothetical protein EOO38_09300 [Cytophagaceae bacterium]|nr:MAG: hypothetical protein EOO38_09300 [Cytophagaceae bacterium]